MHNNITDNKAYEKLVITRMKMVNEMPFWGLVTMELKPVEDRTKPTMAVNGTVLFYNPAFVHALYDCDPKELIFVIAHETLHCVYNHVGKYNRINGRNITVWNWATDFYINQELIDCNVGRFPTVITGLQDDTFKGMHSEEIYDMLAKELEDNYGEDWEKILEGCLEGEPSQNTEMDEKVKERQKKSWDEHMMDNDDEMSEEHKPEEWKEILEDIKDNLPETSADESGVPKGVKLIMSEMTESKVDWKKYVMRIVQSITLRLRTYNKIKKSSINMTVPMPGYGVKQRKVNLHVAIDTSGSVGVKQLSMFVSELVALLKMFPYMKITLIPFDEKVYEDHVVEIDNDNSDIKQLVADVIKPCLVGGGGTRFEVVWEYLKYGKTKPDLLMLFTDGMPAKGWGDPLYCNTLFLIINKHPTARPGFGSVVKIEDI